MPLTGDVKPDVGDGDVSAIRGAISTVDGGAAALRTLSLLSVSLLSLCLSFFGHTCVPGHSSGTKECGMSMISSTSINHGCQRFTVT